MEDDARAAAEIVVEQRHWDLVSEYYRKSGSCDTSLLSRMIAAFERDHMQHPATETAKAARVASNLAALEKLVGFEVDGPCPICKGIEGCDHSLAERFHAATPSPTQPKDSTND